MEVSKDEGPTPNILDFRLGISKSLAILGLVLGMVQGLAAVALPIQANEEHIGLPSPQRKQPEAMMISNVLQKSPRAIQSGFFPILIYEGRQTGQEGLGHQL